VLLVIGLILVTHAVELPSSVDDVVATDTVGWICVVVGALALALAFVVNRRRSTTYVEERPGPGRSR
jgi:hypothetical protein